jgi:hypothetical protein
LEKLALPVGPFPETIPEESSSNDEEHVMIFRLGSIPESDGLKEGTIFKVSHVSDVRVRYTLVYRGLAKIDKKNFPIADDSSSVEQ